MTRAEDGDLRSCSGGFIGKGCPLRSPGLGRSDPGRVYFCQDPANLFFWTTPSVHIGRALVIALVQGHHIVEFFSKPADSDSNDGASERADYPMPNRLCSSATIHLFGTSSM